MSNRQKWLCWLDLGFLFSAYHGHTVSLMEISPYKFKRPGGLGQKEFIHILPKPDCYRGLFQGDLHDSRIGAAYAAEAIKVIDGAVLKGRKVRAVLLMKKILDSYDIANALKDSVSLTGCLCSLL